MAAPHQTDQKEIAVFALDESRYALPVATVERVVRAVEITPLPEAPEIVLGVINAQGRIVPVVDVRRRFGLPIRELKLEDHFIIARTPRRWVALIVDSVMGVAAVDSHQLIDTRQSLAFAPLVKGVVKLADGLALIHDLDQFLSLDEERALDAALSIEPE